MLRTELKRPIYQFIKSLVKDTPFVHSKRCNYHILEMDDKILMVVKQDKKLWIDKDLYSTINNFFSLPLYEADELIVESIKYGWNVECDNLQLI